MRRTFVTLTLLFASSAAFSLSQAQTSTEKATDYQPRTLSPAPAMKVVEQGAGVSVTQAGRGKLLVASDTWDFGWAPQDAYITHRFVVQNVGEDTLFIEDVKPTCGCTVASLDKKTLAPGDKVPVTITVGTKKYSGVLSKKIHVISSDKDSPRYPLTFSANVGKAPGLEFSMPSTIELGDVRAGDSRSAKVSVTNKGERPLQVQIAEAPPYVKATLSQDRLSPAGSIDVAVATAAQPPAGPIQGSLTLEMSGAQISRVTIPITGVGVAN